MAKKSKRRRGPPRKTAAGTLVGLRCQQRFLDAIDGWRERRDDKPTRPAAIIQLAERGLAVTPRGRVSAKAALKAAALAANEIDRMTDQSASVEEQATRKRRLLKGPREFRDMRADNPKKP